MKPGNSLFITVVALALGASLAVGTARASDTVWVFDQTNANLKPCFMFSEATGWKDFGQIAAQGQFAWTTFRSAVQSELGLPTLPNRATVRFTAISPPGPCPAPGAEVDNQTVFQLNGTSNVYIFFGGHATVRRLDQSGDGGDGGDH